ncbi:gp53-like domain-containing protein [Enterobacter cloacae]|uniref:gp53-like domain-containing protein n=1 Tax=Enterobacter cloacae TaxID=550 RepID=UPI003C6F0EC7
MGNGRHARWSTLRRCNIPYSFPSNVFAILATDTGGASVPYGTTNRSKTGFTLTRTSSSGAGNVNGFYLAIGA